MPADLNSTPLDPLKDLRDNPSPRNQIAIALDVSGSMFGPPITEALAGVKDLQGALVKDPFARMRAEVALFTFGWDGAKCVFGFRNPDEFIVPALEAAGGTPMASVLKLMAHDTIARREVLVAAGFAAKVPPILVLFGDGNNTEGPALWDEARTLLLSEQKAGRLVFQAFGTEGANFKELESLSVPEFPPVRIADHGGFRLVFRRIAQSVKLQSQTLHELHSDFSDLTGFGPQKH